MGWQDQSTGFFLKVKHQGLIASVFKSIINYDYQADNCA